MQQLKAGRVFILGLLVLTSYLLYLVFKPFLTSFAWAAFLAIPFYPLHQKLTRLFRGRVTLAAVATTLLITVLILLPIVVLVSSLAGAILTSLPAIEDRIADATGSEQADWQAAPWAGVKGAALAPGSTPVVGPPRCGSSRDRPGPGTSRREHPRPRRGCREHAGGRFGRCAGRGGARCRRLRRRPRSSRRLRLPARGDAEIPPPPCRRDPAETVAPFRHVGDRPGRVRRRRPEASRRVRRGGEPLLPRQRARRAHDVPDDDVHARGLLHDGPETDPVPAAVHASQRRGPGSRLQRDAGHVPRDLLRRDHDGRDPGARGRHRVEAVGAALGRSSSASPCSSARSCRSEAPR